MRLAASFLLLTLLFVGASSFQDLLAPLDAGRSYNRYSILESISSALTPDHDDDKAMKVDIATDFVRRFFNNEEVSVQDVVRKFERLYEEFSQEWKQEMVTKMIESIGIDMGNAEMVRKIRQDPQSFAMDYKTYKILTYKN